MSVKNVGNAYKPDFTREYNILLNTLGENVLHHIRNSRYGYCFYEKVIKTVKFVIFPIGTDPDRRPHQVRRPYKWPHSGMPIRRMHDRLTNKVLAESVGELCKGDQQSSQEGAGFPTRRTDLYA